MEEFCFPLVPNCWGATSETHFHFTFSRQQLQNDKWQKPQGLWFLFKVPVYFTPQWRRTAESMVSRITPRAGWESSGRSTGSSVASGVMVWGCNLRQKNSSMLIKGTISQKQVSVLLIPLPSGVQWPSASQVSGERAQGHVAVRWGQQEISRSSCPARLPECSEHRDPYHGGSAELLLPQTPSLSSVELIPLPGMSNMVPSIETTLEMIGGRPVASDGARHTKSFWICASYCRLKSDAEFTESVWEMEAK